MILAAEPGSYLYAGLRRGIDRADAGARGRPPHLRTVPASASSRGGDCYFLPAGVVHALGPGLLVAEIQQASDITYRLYDWGRPGPDGRAAPAARRRGARGDRLSISARSRPPSRSRPANRPSSDLSHCDEFVLDRWRLTEARQVGGDNRCHILAVVSGEVQIEGDPAGAPLAQGRRRAACRRSWAPVRDDGRGEAVLLDAYLP